MFVIFNLDETKFNIPCAEKLQYFQLIAKCDITFYRILRYLYNVFSHLGSKKQRIWTFLGGFEPPIFRLTTECANQLRHRDVVVQASMFD